MSWSMSLLLTALIGAANPSDDDPTAKADPSGDAFAEAQALRDREEWAEAGEKFREVMEKAADAPVARESRFWAGFCLVKQGEHDRAIEVLLPFEGDLAEDTWADDALLHLGHAYREKGEKVRAAATWNRQVETYADSVWRLEVMLRVVDLLFADGMDFPGCLAACERVVAEFPGREGTTEARYDGAYCLNVLRRFPDSEKWAEAHFDPESPLEEAWRRVLAAQRDFLGGKVAPALAAVDSLDVDFPDLDQGSRQDLKIRTTSMLRFNGRSDRAEQLILDELRGSSGRPEDEVRGLLDELSEIIGEERRADFRVTLTRLAEGTDAPMVVRVAALERHARSLAEGGDAGPASDLLRVAVEKEPLEYPRVRAALLLAEFLAEDDQKRPEAAQVLEDLLLKVGRRDLAHQVRVASEKYRAESQDQ